MDFRFTEDQLLLTESVRDYLAAIHGQEVLRRLDQGDKRDPAIWQGLVDMGLTALLFSSPLAALPPTGAVPLKVRVAALKPSQAGNAPPPSSAAP